VLVLENISFRLPGRAVLQDINLQLKRGSLTVITGPNGSGKTTLAKIISGILQPTQGVLRFEGRNITRLGVTRRAKLGICCTFQQPVRFRGISVRDLLLLAAGEGTDELELSGYLEQVGLCPEDYLHREVDAALSGGEIKRIEIASALARGAQLTIFDEPEAGIDLWSFQNLVQIFQALRNQGKTLLLLSHQERILSIADEVLLAKDGGLLPCGALPKSSRELL
jgi:Fe-S cluster assembly ATP-binding protein